MFLCLNQPHYPRRPQFLPFQHLQPLLLLQFEQGKIDMEFVGIAMKDIIDRSTIEMLLETTEYAEGIAVLIVYAHNNFTISC